MTGGHGREHGVKPHACGLGVARILGFNFVQGDVTQPSPIPGTFSTSPCRLVRATCRSYAWLGPGDVRFQPPMSAILCQSKQKMLAVSLFLWTARYLDQSSRSSGRSFQSWQITHELLSESRYQGSFGSWHPTISSRTPGLSPHEPSAECSLKMAAAFSSLCNIRIRC